MKHRRVLLLGAYGQTNLGDDLLLYNYVQLLHNKGFDEIYINTSRSELLPKSVTQDFSGIRTFETYGISPLDLLRLLRSADCIVYGGGTVFKELYASTGRSKYSVIANVALFNFLAKLLGKPVYGLHIGIGSIKTWLGRTITKIALSCSTETTFRDRSSYKYALNTLKIAPKKINLATDGLFINRSWQKPWHQLELPPHKGKTIGVNVLSDIPDWVDRTSYITNTLDFLNKLMADGNYLVFMPFQTDFNPNNDLKFMRDEILPKLDSRSYTVIETLDLRTIISCLQQIDLLVGMRLHSLLLATMAGTPFVGLAYDTKCWRFMQENAYPHAIKLEDATADGLYQVFQKALADETAAKKLACIREENLKEADLWLQKAAV